MKTINDTGHCLKILFGSKIRKLFYLCLSMPHQISFQSTGFFCFFGGCQHGGRNSSQLFQRWGENMSCSLKLQNTFWRDGGTCLHLLVGSGGHSHGWDGGTHLWYIYLIYLLFGAIHWFTFDVALMLKSNRNSTKVIHLTHHTSQVT